MSLGAYRSARYYTQHPWIQLCTKLKYMWVWQDVIPNILKFSYALSSSTCDFTKVPDPNIIGFSYALSLITRGFNNVPDPTSSGFSYTLNPNACGSGNVPNPSPLQVSDFLSPTISFVNYRKKNIKMNLW